MRDDGYCAAPFFHLALASADGVWKPCCYWDQDISSGMAHDHLDPMSNQWMDELRRGMLRGDWHPGCSRCRTYESAQGWSLRRQFNDEMGRLDQPLLRYVELNLGNLCNLKCTMCSSESSSRWAADDHAMGRTAFGLVRRDASSLALDLSTVDRMKIVGGEPSLEQDGIKSLLRGMSAARGGLSHLHLEIFTNGMVPFDGELLDMLLSCRIAVIQLSMDGMGAANDYQRTGSRWETVEANARLYHGLCRDGFGLCIASCIGLFTVGSATSFVDWVARDLPMAKHIVNAIDNPREQALRNVPPAYRRVLLDALDSWRPVRPSQPDWLPYGGTNTELIASLLRSRLLQEPELSASDVRLQVDLLDAINGTSLRASLPDLHGFLYG